MITYYRNTEIPNTVEGEYQLFKLAIEDLINQTNSSRITGIEIGVYNGNTSAYLLSLNDKIFLTGIDPIIPDSMEKSMIGNLELIKSNTEKYKDRWKFIQDYSYNVVNNFNLESIDFIFIDGSHHYDDVKRDWLDYFLKVKKGGLIFMHDSRMFRTDGAPFHKGSSQFTKEIIDNPKNFIELIGESFSLTCFKKLL